MEGLKEVSKVYEINTYGKRQTVFTLGIGDIVVADSDSIIKTNLGSCVAVILYDTVKKIGGMIHIIMPKSNSKSKDKPGRFADTGIPLLIQQFKENGACIRNAQISIVGGNNLIINEKITSSIFSEIGKSNLEAVKNILTSFKLRFKELSVGQRTGTVVSLNTNTGTVDVHSLKNTYQCSIG